MYGREIRKQRKKYAAISSPNNHHPKTKKQCYNAGAARAEQIIIIRVQSTAKRTKKLTICVGCFIIIFFLLYCTRIKSTPRSKRG